MKRTPPTPAELLAQWERKREYRRAYDRRPEVVEKRRAYTQRPEVKERQRAAKSGK